MFGTLHGDPGPQPNSPGSCNSTTVRTFQMYLIEYGEKHLSEEELFSNYNF